MEDPDGSKMLKNMEDQLAPLSDEKRASMSEEDIQNYEANKEMVETIKEQIVNQPIREQHWHILDTDYDNYLIQYACQEMTVKVNQFGQTEDDVESLKMETPE